MPLLLDLLRDLNKFEYVSLRGNRIVEGKSLKEVAAPCSQWHADRAVLGRARCGRAHVCFRCAHSHATVSAAWLQAVSIVQSLAEGLALCAALTAIDLSQMALCKRSSAEHIACLRPIVRAPDGPPARRQQRPFARPPLRHCEAAGAVAERSEYAVRVHSAPLGSARLGSARLGSARLAWLAARRTPTRLTEGRRRCARKLPLARSHLGSIPLRPDPS